MPPFFHVAMLCAIAEGLRTRRQDTVELMAGAGKLDSRVSYTFNKFMQDFGRVYEVGSEEYARRAAVFEQSLMQIHAINSRGGSSWMAGVYPFMDWTSAERAARLHGYDPSVGSVRVRLHREQAVTLQTGTGAATQYGGADDSFEAETPAVHSQGSLCGSCWAFSAVEAVEAQLMKSGAWKWEDGEPRLSVQALLDCMPNPRHCGGKGGCDGATPELAFDFMQSSGLPLERDLPYHPTQTGVCPIEPYPSDWVRVTLAGWRALPRNLAQPLMQALVQEGPVVVAADAHGWYPYQRGIFDGCSKDAIPNHSALAKGYGTDGVDGTENHKYWLLQNSWGLRWGERGTIRLLRRDNEDQWCGSDSHPEQGSGCADEPHRNVTVCGSCGLLYDPVIPHVGHVEVQQSEDPLAPHANNAAGVGLAVLATQMGKATPPPMLSLVSFADSRKSDADSLFPDTLGTFSQTASPSSNRILSSPATSDGRLRFSDSQTLVETAAGNSAANDRADGAATGGESPTPIASSVAGRVQEVIRETEGSEKTASLGLF